MTLRSVHDVYGLPEHDRGSPLFIHPLELVVAPDVHRHPLLIVGFDLYGPLRSVTDVARIDPLCTHVNLTLLSGGNDAPITRGFGAQCFVSTFDGQAFVHINSDPKLRETSRLYDEVDRLSAYQRFRHPCTKLKVTGEVNDEWWRITDTTMCTQLTPTQYERALRAIREWEDNPPPYQVRAFQDKKAVNEGKNCCSFVHHVMTGADIRPPVWWGWKPWPPLDARSLEFHIAAAEFGSSLPKRLMPWTPLQTQELERKTVPGLLRDRHWFYQSRRATAHMRAHIGPRERVLAHQYRDRDASLWQNEPVFA